MYPTKAVSFSPRWYSYLVIEEIVVLQSPLGLVQISSLRIRSRLGLAWIYLDAQERELGLVGVLNKDSKEGTYSVLASHDSKIIGSLNFLVEHKKFSLTGSSVKPLQTINILESIIVTTDKGFYADGETIIILGEVRDLHSGFPVTLQVIAANGNIVRLAQLEVESDKKFETEFTIGGQLWSSSGTYTVKVSYGGNTRTAVANFEYSSSGLGGTSSQTSHYTGPTGRTSCPRPSALHCTALAAAPLSPPSTLPSCQ